MPTVTKEQRRGWWEVVVTGAATSLFLALIFGGLSVWSNDSTQDERIFENQRSMERNQDRIDELTRELKEEVRELRKSISQGDGELRALSLQILQEIKK